jgi:hypothetical protein
MDVKLSVTLRKETGLLEFEMRMLRTISRPNTEEVIGGRKKKSY